MSMIMPFINFYLACLRVLLILEQPNSPNPFNPTTTIEFGLPEEGVVRMEIFDVTGRRAAILIDEERPAGLHKAVWGAKDDSGSTVASGVYFCRVTFHGQVLNRKIILMR